MSDTDSVASDQQGVLTVDGVDVVRYVRSGVLAPWADRAVALVPVDRAVPLILGAMPGWQFVPDVDEDPVAGHALAEALLAHGATLSRHALGYTFALDQESAGAEISPQWNNPVLPQGSTLDPIRVVTDELVELCSRAFPDTHPDHDPEDQRTHDQLAMLIEGDTLGPLLDGTAQVVRDGRPMAALIINRFVGTPPYGGPWITDVFRDPDDPDARGLGAALIRRALARLAAAGESALSLAVTFGNPAAQGYESIGFAQCWDVRRLKLPGDVAHDDATG